MKITTANEAREALDYCEYPYTQANKRETYKILQKVLTLKDKVLEAEARYQYFQHLIFLSEHDEAIVHYAWLLNYLNKATENGWQVNSENIVWAFKWIIDDLPSFADIPLVKQGELWQQFVDVYARNNAGDKVVDYFDMEVQLKLGQLEKSLEALKRYKSSNARKGRYDDCKACQKDRLIDIYNYHGNFKESVKNNNKVGKDDFRCMTVPKSTYPKLCFSNMMVQNYSAAEHFFRLTLEHNNMKESETDVLQNVLYYLAVKKDFTPALKIIRAQLRFTFQTKNDFLNMHFLHACHYLLAQMQISGYKQVNLKIKELEFLNPVNGKHRLETLLPYLHEKYTYHMTRIDNRNNNNFWQSYLQNLETRLNELVYSDPGA